MVPILYAPGKDGRDYGTPRIFAPHRKGGQAGNVEGTAFRHSLLGGGGMGIGGSILKVYPTQRQALLELLDAGDEMARTIEASSSNSPAFWTSQQGTALQDWNELRKQHERTIDKIVNR
jgi:hypothetical protein